MTNPTIAAAILALAMPTAAASVETALSLEAQAKLRCAAAFALVSHGQDNGNEAAKKWPDVSERGREFFVRALAGLMDETGLDREGIGRLVSAEAQKLWDKDEIDDVMPACLVMLESSGL
ncbi:hypothetical protein P7228_04430 [Altererythrobacter arenosus]|uniref:Uncharacterized protein n=1 Tax=Altererythrobacter arenosus TaxID=3032592 RepID=A0ABY8FU16_9SPHN|nr:hypothetical protein [Altererythrobacter sp. CAU 1644]WFL78317.1 hypothetical protein P7228_04430 [Altererythrobacter sp. CAU 1644]